VCPAKGTITTFDVSTAGMIQLRQTPGRRLAFGVGLAVVGLAAVWTECGGSSGSGSGSGYRETPKGAATFSVSATSGTTTISTQVTMTAP
jgi:hypothetical protein